ncbi:MAG: magnesium/cobalt transporter CorA [Cyanobacteria bacterium SID2]|nr:magnesium/cobalt transporter CorA [Cyanobacteria bacterium SID2]MBP0006161.1 magnesium/cobalt transporter CorA [Cyanobacteria bacterium SBC]
MKDYFHERPGSVPGTLIFDENTSPAQLALFDWDGMETQTFEDIEPEACTPYLESDSVSWIDVRGLGDGQFWQQMGKVFDLHPLLLEDLVNTPQRPKVEEYDDRLVIISRLVVPRDNKPGFDSQQIGFVLTANYLLTVRERLDLDLRDSFEPVRERLRANKLGRCSVDYLAYTLIDAAIDGFFPVLEQYGERLAHLEEEVVAEPTPHTLQKIYQLRRELLELRRAIWPQRSVVNLLSRTGNDPIVSTDVRLYLRHCYDHVLQVLEMVETYRELASGLMDVYLSAVSNKTNEVMKVLTVISTIFIPLTFLVGVYGMNFNPESSPWNMPELNWYWGYPVFWAVTLVIAMGSAIFFWRRGWFETTSGFEED